MNKQYFWKTLFTYERNLEDMKLLDSVDELFEGERKNIRTIYHDSAFDKTLSKENQYSGKIKVLSSEFSEPYDWVRVSADVYFKDKEWTLWKMTQFIADFKAQDKSIRSQMFRIQNLVPKDKTTRIFLDIRKPEKNFDELEILFWNSDGPKPIDINDLKVEVFQEF